MSEYYCENEQESFAEVFVNRSAIEFPNTYIYTESNPIFVDIINSSTGTAVLKGIDVLGPFVCTKRINSIIPPGETVRIPLVFKPTVTGTASGYCTIYQTGHEDIEIALAGECIEYTENNSSGGDSGGSGGTVEVGLNEWEEDSTDDGASVWTPKTGLENAPAIIKPKGTGYLGSNTNGTKGKYAVDLQLNTNSLAQSASGELSGILSGGYNVASGIESVVVGGTRNVASGDGSSITSGQGNQSLGMYSSVHNGSGNTVHSNGAVVISGNDNTIGEPTPADKQVNEGEYGLIGSGHDIIITGNNSSVINGQNITVDGDLVTIGVGSNLTVTGNYCYVGSSADSLIIGSQFYAGYVNESTITDCSELYVGSLIQGSVINTDGFIGFARIATIQNSENIFVGSTNRVTLTNSVNSSVVSGDLNSIDSSEDSLILAGSENSINNRAKDLNVHAFDSKHNVILGGTLNNISGSAHSYIGLGNSNDISGVKHSVILSGSNNTIEITDSVTKTYGNNSVINGNANTIIDSFCANILGCYNSISNGDHTYVLGSYKSVVVDSEYCSVHGGKQNTIQFASNATILGGEYNIVSASDTGSIVGGRRNKISGRNSVALGGEFGSDFGIKNHTFTAIRDGVNWVKEIPDDTTGLSSGVVATDDDYPNWVNNNPVFQRGEVVLQKMPDPTKGNYDGTNDVKEYLLTASRKYLSENIWYNLPSSESNTITIPEYSCMFWELEISLVNFDRNSATKMICKNGIITDSDNGLLIHKTHEFENHGDANLNNCDITVELDIPTSTVRFMLPHEVKNHVGGAVFKYTIATQGSTNFYWNN